MKKILLSLVLTLSTISYGQVCTVDTAVHSLASVGFPSLEWSGLWANGELPSFACDSTQPMMNLSAVVGQPFESMLTGMLGDTFPSGGLLVPTTQAAFLYTTTLPSWLSWTAADSIFYPGPSNKTCIKLSGTPTLADTTYYIPSVGVESGFFTSWYQVSGAIFGFPAVDTSGFCHNIRVFKDYTDLEDLPLATMTLSPNPAKDYLNLYFNQAVVTDELMDQIIVYNVIGNRIDIDPTYLSSNKIGFDISKLPVGNYWLTIDVEKGLLRSQFVVTR